MNYVPGSGNPRARLMLVGEAPGAREVEEGECFVGPTGKMVAECVERAGYDMSEVYKTNVVKVRPPDNKIEKLKLLGTKIDDFLPTLWKEIEDVNPNCILAFGNTALKALTGEKGIREWRGSILPNIRSVLPKVVPTIHPASLLHQSESDGKMKNPREAHFIQLDVNRAVKQSEFRERNVPQRNLIIAKNSLDLHRFIQRHDGLTKVAYDIETFKAIPMCISFAFSRHEAISIPLFHLLGPRNEEGIPMHDMVEVWKMVQDLLSNPRYQLIGHNLKFDQGRLEEINFEVRDPYFDTQLGWHSMYSELPKKLAFIASVITEEPYYKDELEEYNPKKDKLNKRLLYNAKDSAVTFEIYEKEEAELREAGMWEWHMEYMQPLHKFYRDIEKRGLLIDASERKRLDTKYSRYIRWINRSLRNDLGYELNVNSPKQVFTTLFGDLKCPLRKGTDEETLEMLMLNAVKDDKRKRIINNILKGRKARKTKSTYISAKVSPDGYMRTVFNITGTESGRSSTSKPKPPVVMEPMGVAFQTMTKHGEVGVDLRSMYVPAPGNCFIEIDGKAAEDWVVTHLARDMAGLAELGRTKFIKNKFGLKDDRHTKTAMAVLGLDFEAVTDDQRQIGKKTRHAGNYKMGKRRLSLLAGISEWRAGKCLDRFHDENPLISAIYWEEIIQALRDGQILFSASGFRRQFFQKWGEDLFKEAFSFIPQNVVAHHTRQTARRCEQRLPWLRIVLEAHDSFTVEVPISSSDEAIKVMIEEYETPIDFSKCSLPRGPLVIPSEVMIGKKDWMHMEKVA